jgi:hypothetical protein
MIKFNSSGMTEENLAIQSASSRHYNKQMYKIIGDLVYLKSDVGSTEKKMADVKSTNISSSAPSCFSLSSE